MNSLPVVSPEISVIVPALNESENLPQLKDSLMRSLELTGRSFEIFFVDDGSEDNSFEIIQQFANETPSISGLRLAKNFGKSAALAAGFGAATGEILLTMDADNQDDPSEIPRFLKKIEEGSDLVVGWKKDRKDSLTRVTASRIFNRVIGFLSGVPLHATP